MERGVQSLQPLLQALVKSRPGQGVDSLTPQGGLGAVAPPPQCSSDSDHLSQRDADHRSCRAGTARVPGHRQAWQRCPGETDSLLLLSQAKDLGTRAAGARRHLILPCPPLGDRPQPGAI